MVLEVGGDIMILKGMQGCIDSKPEVIVSKEGNAEEGSNEGTDLGTRWEGGQSGGEWGVGVGVIPRLR